MSRRIGRFVYGTTPTWGTWTPSLGASQASEVAAEVAASDLGRTCVAEAIRDYDREIDRVDGLVGAAVWVPQADPGMPMAVMVAGSVRGDTEMPAVDEYADELRRPARRRGVKVLDRTVERVDLPVGPAVVETEITASRTSRRVVCGVAWTVFPNGYLDTVQMHFRTSFPDVLDALRGESELMVGSLQIEPDEAS